MSKNIYHYTHLAAARQILHDGYLCVSQWEIDNKVEHPALWLSLHPHWEPTATKMIVNDKGVPYQLSFEEQWASIGCVRFVLPFERMKLIRWDRFKAMMRTDPAVIFESMERVGRESGANPDDWYASLENISLDEVIACQIWTGSKWMDVEMKKEMMNPKKIAA